MKITCAFVVEAAESSIWAVPLQRDQSSLQRQTAYCPWHVDLRVRDVEKLGADCCADGCNTFWWRRCDGVAVESASLIETGLIVVGTNLIAGKY